METIIKIAIAGGYKTAWPSSEDKDLKNHCICVLDALFWQALGKSCGWKNTGLHKTCLCHKEGREVMEWEIYAIQFHEINLSEGWNAAVHYLKNLIEKKDE
jgi:hypothetical protein